MSKAAAARRIPDWWALLDGAHGKAGYKASDEEIIDNSDWDACNQAGRHHRAPEIDIAPHKKGRHADAHRIARRGGDKRHAVDKLLRYQSEGKDHRRVELYGERSEEH